MSVREIAKHDYSRMDVPIAAPPKRWRYVVWALAAVVIGVAVVYVFRLKEAVPTVSRSDVLLDTVMRGKLTREVGGPGTLVAFDTRWISSDAGGRVDEIMVEPGDAVSADTVLLRMRNAELEQSLLESEHAYIEESSELEALAASLEVKRADYEVELANTRTEYEDIRRRAASHEALSKAGALPELQIAHESEQLLELKTRYDMCRERLAALAHMRDAQLNAQRAKVDRAAALRKLRRDQVDGLVVRARSPGVLQERLVKVGQQVGPGDLLAKVVDPTRLQAELRIPEARAREIALGQQARVDLRIAEVTGQVRRVDPAVQDGNVMVVIGFPTPLPEGARPDLSVDGNIVLQQLQNVLYLRLPAGARPNSRVSLFRLARGSRRAERVQVELGEGSMSLVEARSTLQAGDQVVVSDTSEWASNDAFELK